MVNQLLFILLMAQPQEGGKGNPIMSFLPLILIIVVFYFFMIRPQVKRQKELRKFRESLKKGDRVITTGGIYAKIADIKEDTLLLEIDNNVRIKVDKNSVVRDTSDIEQKK